MSIVSRVSGYKLNVGALEDLRLAGVPQSLVGALQVLQDRHFASRAQFVAAVRAVDAGRQLNDNEQRVLACARVLRVTRIARYLESYWDTLVPRSRFVVSFYNYILLRPLIMAIRLRLRWWLFFAIAKCLGRPVVRQAINANLEGFTHNRNQVLSFLAGHRNRTESLMNVLRAIQGIELRNSRVLCVGPRNEAEVLMLYSYGCARRNVQSIDLFSYSPLIRVMDMNSLEYADDSFDIYYSSAVIKYSPDIKRTIAESLRVTRAGGLMVFGFMFGETSGIIPEGSELSGGVPDLLVAYGDHVDHVYWHERFPYAPGDIRAAVIFRVKK